MGRARVPDRIRVCQWGTFDVANYGDRLFPLIAKEELTTRLPGLELTCYAPLGDATLPPGSPPPLPLVPGGDHYTGSGESTPPGTSTPYSSGGGDLLPFDRSEPGYGNSEHEGPLRPYEAFLDFLWAESEPNILWNAPGLPFPFEPSRRLLVQLARSHVRYAAVRDEVSRGGVGREIPRRDSGQTKPGDRLAPHGAVPRGSGRARAGAESEREPLHAGGGSRVAAGDRGADRGLRLLRREQPARKPHRSIFRDSPHSGQQPAALREARRVGTDSPVRGVQHHRLGRSGRRLRPAGGSDPASRHGAPSARWYGPHRAPGRYGKHPPRGVRHDSRGARAAGRREGHLARGGRGAAKQAPPAAVALRSADQAPRSSDRPLQNARRRARDPVAKTKGSEREPEQRSPRHGGVQDLAVVRPLPEIARKDKRSDETEIRECERERRHAIRLKGRRIW